MPLLSIQFIRQQINNASFLAQYPADFKKAYFFFLLMMNTGGLMWGILCLLFGFYLISIIPFGYIVFSFVNLQYLLQRENFVRCRSVQVLFSLLLPFLFQWLLGGFNATGVVMLWSMLTLIALLTFSKAQEGNGWWALFIMLLVGSAMADGYLAEFTPAPLKVAQVQRILLTINIGMIASITFFLFKFFIKSDRHTKLMNQQLAQQKHDLSERHFEIEQQNEEILSINDELQRQTIEIEQKRVAMMGSINYAKNIQKALHSSSKGLRQVLPESFVLNQPKDIVSGDFFWFTQTEAKPIYQEISTFDGIQRVFQGFENEKILIAAIDCTGHGVPGAFMTVMGKVFIDEIVLQHHLTDPAKILTTLDKKIVHALTSNTSLNDGMDMSLMMLDQDDHTLVFSGAKNPLWYVRNGIMHQVSGSKFPIGSGQYKYGKSFENTYITTQPGDVFYIFSDGFQDQFGGREDKKYMKRRFRELLLSISSLPLTEQKQLLKQELKAWRKNNYQTDDVLVVGVKV
ncbi:SpoIIE family protein phosphatase [uncultured Microscilla sp.]|uniref:PP2C family protein-serine/threonine phosphatase n=1 Tax=uncultured Microscilla sp. TaxID=432653 RepID=UPI0026100A54|nr:SpoIIE family protein phosphatase [uncultured Microscilla sp.]